MEKVFLVIASLIVSALAIFAPLPWKPGEKVLTGPLLSEGRSLGINLWFPQETISDVVLGAETDVPEITAKAAIFVDTQSGKVLYSKNIHQKLPIASLAKVMTAVVALEYRNLDEKLLVSSRAAGMEPDEMILLPGEKLTLKDLLYGIFLISANDAAEVLAETTTGDREQFIKLMNKKAQDLGMKDNLFVNPTGLDEDSGNSYSTVFDMAVLTRYAIRKYPVLVEISQTEHIYLPITKDHQDYDMYSGINLLTTYPGVVGFKTGYTPEAGLTLITLARKNGHEVLGVLLGSENRREEAKELLDYSFEQL